MNSQAVLPSPSRYVRLQSCGGEIIVDNYQRQGEVARKGYVPVMVVGEGAMERFVIPTKFLPHPSIVALLELSADEFGYGHEGVLRIPCDPDCFRALLKSFSFKKR